MREAVGARLLHRPAEAERRRVLRRRLAKSVLIATLLFGSLFAAPGTADAATFSVCGHQVVTDYDQGWIVIRSMTGSHTRPDLYVTGTAISPFNGRIEIVSIPVRDAIDYNVHWAGFDQAQIWIVYHDQCWAYVR